MVTMREIFEDMDFSVPMDSGLKKRYPMPDLAKIRDPNKFQLEVDHFKEVLERYPNLYSRMEVIKFFAQVKKWKEESESMDGMYPLRNDVENRVFVSKDPPGSRTDNASRIIIGDQLAEVAGLTVGDTVKVFNPVATNLRLVRVERSSPGLKLYNSREAKQLRLIVPGMLASQTNQVECEVIKASVKDGCFAFKIPASLSVRPLKNA